ncbi:hypothetical protein ACP70R_022373 [Stipagrostis hirtigluma subsp. patula]
MATTSKGLLSLAFVLLALPAPLAVVAGDPDILADFIPPLGLGGAPNITGEYFTFKGFRTVLTAPAPQNLTVTKATMEEFPVLKGQGVSYALISYPPGSVNPPHTHPRASRLLLVIEGVLSVGFIDTANKLYAQDLVAGDMFIIPKGMVQWQYNAGTALAKTLSAFGSAAPGMVSMPVTLFGTGIDDAVLAKSFKTDVPTVQKLKAALTPPNK